MPRVSTLASLPLLALSVVGCRLSVVGYRLSDRQLAGPLGPACRMSDDRALANRQSSIANLAAGAFPFARPFVIPDREVIQIGNPPARRVDQLCDVRQLGEVDLLYFVG